MAALDIAGYLGRPVPNAFFRQDGETRHLGLILPGLRYRSSMPALYYPALLLKALGADVLAVNYRYDEEPGLETLPDAERAAWWTADAAAVIDAALAQRRYERVTIVGKSLGTGTMARLLADDERLRTAEAIWLTPVLKKPGFPDLMGRCPQRGLVVIGTADWYYDEHILADLERRGLQVLVVRDVTHGLECPGDAVRSAEAIVEITQAVSRFLAGT